MLSIFRKKKSEPVYEPPSKYLRAKSGKVLISAPERQSIIKKVKRAFSVTDDVWNEHYLFAIEQFAELAQELPASEIHHHSKEGGLIDHTLEAVFAGVRVTQGYILPPNTEAEKISVSTDRWRFGVFIAILSHDLGKVVTDIEVVFKNKEGKFEKWHPWFGSLPENSEYAFRYRERLNNSRIEKSLHEKASMSLLPKLLTKKAAFWIFDDYELIGQLFNTVSHATFGGGAISEIVRKADSSSVGNNLGASTGVGSTYSSNIPMHEKLITSLRNLISDGDLKRNRPGSALWVTKDETWLVSKTGMEATRAKLLNEGHKGIPTNVVRLYEILREHDLIIPTPEGNSVWTAKVDDNIRNWQMNLTFLRFKNEILWPTTNPEHFDGSVTPLDKDGNEFVDTDISVDQGIPAEVESNHSQHEEAAEQTTTGEAASTEIESNKQPPPPKPKQVTLKEEKAKKDNIIRQEKAPQIKKGAPENENVAPQNDFLFWLIKAIEGKKLRVNEPTAMVHILDDYVALATPGIFATYLQRNTLKAKVYESRAGEKPPYTVVQKEVEALNINQKSSQGENIHKMLVEGPHKQSELKVYLINRNLFPSLNNFSSNKAMKIKL